MSLILILKNRILSEMRTEQNTEFDVFCDMFKTQRVANFETLPFYSSILFQIFVYYSKNFF